MSRRKLGAKRLQQISGGYSAVHDVETVPMAQEVLDLRVFVRDIADRGCEYSDNCPSDARHYVCLSCRAVRELARTATYGAKP